MTEEFDKKAKAKEYYDLLLEASKASDEVRTSFCKGMNAAYIWRDLQEAMTPEEGYEFCVKIGLGDKESVKKLGELVAKKKARAEKIKAQVWWKPQTWVLW